MKLNKELQALRKQYRAQTRQPKELVLALKQATSGNIDTALPVIEKFYELGDFGCAVALAEIYAYQGRWSESFNMAFDYLLGVQPSNGSRPVNLYVECIQLIAASCTEEIQLREQVPALLELAQDVLQKRLKEMPILEVALSNLSDFSDMPQDRKDEIRQQIEAYGLSAYMRLLDQLRSFLACDDYESVFYNSDCKNNYLQQTPDLDSVLAIDQISQAFQMCSGNGPLLTELLERYGYGPWLFEDHLRDITKFYISKGDEVHAWAAVEALASNWQPTMTTLSVLPSILITDPTIRNFLKGERMMQIMQLQKCKRWLP